MVEIRGHRVGDIGYIIHRHGVLYNAEYGFNERFEAYVARILSDFILDHDPQKERLWVAESDGEIVGSVAIIKAGSASVGRFRLFYLEPHMRGQGLGSRLFDTAIDFARAVGYAKLTLETQGQLTAARAIYQRAGFRCIDQQPHRGFVDEHEGALTSASLIDEIWELELTVRSEDRATE